MLSFGLPAADVFPVHRTLIADHGIYLVENLNLEELVETVAQEGSRSSYSW